MDQLPNYAGAGMPQLPPQGQHQPQHQQQQHPQQHPQHLSLGGPGMQASPPSSTPGFFMQNPPSHIPPAFYQNQNPNAFNPQFAGRPPHVQTHSGVQQGFGTPGVPVSMPHAMMGSAGLPGGVGAPGFSGMMMNPAMGANPHIQPNPAFMAGGMQAGFNQQSLPHTRPLTGAPSLPSSVAPTNPTFSNARAPPHMQPNMAAQQPEQQTQQQHLQSQRVQQAPVPPQASHPNQMGPAGGTSGGQQVAIPAMNPQAAAREKARIALLLDINSALLQELFRLQAAGKAFFIPGKDSQHAHSQSKDSNSSSTPNPQDQHSQQPQQPKQPKMPPHPEYAHCMRRLQANLEYIANVADREKKAQMPGGQIGRIIHAPAVLTSPPNVPSLEPLYAKLNELFPNAAANQAAAQARAQAAAASGGKAQGMYSGAGTSQQQPFQQQQGGAAAPGNANMQMNQKPGNQMGVMPGQMPGGGMAGMPAPGQGRGYNMPANAGPAGQFNQQRMFQGMGQEQGQGQGQMPPSNMMPGQYRMQMPGPGQQFMGAPGGGLDQSGQMGMDTSQGMGGEPFNMMGDGSGGMNG